MSSSGEPFITLYTVGTPNGQKASIALEELGIPYKTVKIDFSKQEQKQESFLKINPNGRIPAIVDHKRGDFPVFESGAILLYLAEHYDPKHILLPQDANKRSEAIQWLMWQMGGLGPMQGQANHFFRYAPEKIQYGISRYQEETRRLYSVMERQLAHGKPYLIGDEYSVADIASFGWTAAHNWAGVSLDEFPKVDKWLHTVAKREGVKRGMDVPDKSNLIDNDFALPEDAEKKAKEASQWIMQKDGQK
ncbi:glutathione S-transferase [Phlyctochytrium arcticum]|nr:glutathione S-transferase [Phlyctochytrium arcticum]